MEVGMIMAKVMDAEPGMEIYDPCCGSGGLLIKCEIALEKKLDYYPERMLQWDCILRWPGRPGALCSGRAGDMFSDKPLTQRR